MCLKIHRQEGKEEKEGISEKPFLYQLSLKNTRKETKIKKKMGKDIKVGNCLKALRALKIYKIRRRKEKKNCMIEYKK